MTRTEFLRQQTISGANKCRRTPIPPMSVANEPCSLSERKALALKMTFDTMPVYIGPKELIVGTKTYYTPLPGNEDGHDHTKYSPKAPVKYINEQDIALFGCDQSYRNRTHFTPDFSIILNKGIGGILRDAEERKTDSSLHALNREFLSAVTIAYRGLQNLILRYATKAEVMANDADGADRKELFRIAEICRKISADPPSNFHEAVQLLWFAHLGTIVESFELINYGRLDVLLGEFLGDTPREEAAQLIECLLLKMYDQTDLVSHYPGHYSGQLVVTLGGILPNGENAVNEVTMMFLDGIDHVRLPDPEFNLRISSKNPPEFLDRAAELTVSGCNYVSYYNDDLFVENLHQSGIPLEDARDYGFDLCQDINIPGRSDFWLAGEVDLAFLLMDFLKENRTFSDFNDLLRSFKAYLPKIIDNKINELVDAEALLDLYATGKADAYFHEIKNNRRYVDRAGNSPMAPLPLLSALFHGCIENALDVAFEPYPIRDKGILFRTVPEAVNSLAAIKKVVYEDKLYSLDEIYHACESNYEEENGEQIRKILWNCPKWGNDDDYVDSIAKDLLEFCLRKCDDYKTYFGANILGGIHQPHPVAVGRKLMATPEGRKATTPIAVTLSPENGTMKNGPTAALMSAVKIDPTLVRWNFCVMINYFASVFQGNEGKTVFKTLLTNYFKAGGLQHQPNISDADLLKKAQQNPEQYKDLIVRLWGISSRFVELRRDLQDEIIARFS